MIVATAVLGTIGTLVGMVWALLNIRDKLWPRPVVAHPLEPALRDIAAAVRELELGTR